MLGLSNNSTIKDINTNIPTLKGYESTNLKGINVDDGIKHRNISYRSRGFKYFNTREKCPVCEKHGKSCRSPVTGKEIYEKVFCRGISDDIKRGNKIGDYIFKKTDINGFKMFIHESIKDKQYTTKDLRFTNDQRNHKLISIDQASSEMKGLSYLLGLNDDAIDFLRSKGLSDFEINALRLKGVISSHANSFPIAPPRNNDLHNVEICNKHSSRDKNKRVKNAGYRIDNQVFGTPEIDESLWYPEYFKTLDKKGKFGFYKPTTNQGYKYKNNYHSSVWNSFNGNGSMTPSLGATEIGDFKLPSTYIPQVNVDGRLQYFPTPMMHVYVIDEFGRFKASQIRNLWHKKLLSMPDWDQVTENIDPLMIHKWSLLDYEEDWQKSQVFHGVNFIGKYIWCNPQTKNESLSPTEVVDSRTEDFEPSITFANKFTSINERQKLLTNAGINFIQDSDYFSVLLCEGILKPQIANLRTGMTAIGAAGGNFMSSVKQLDRYIRTIQKQGIQKDKVVNVLFAPDAGTLNNKNVLKQLVKTINHLKNKDFVFVQILDWGQLKNDNGNDIDEISITEFKNAKQIKANDFLELEEVKDLDNINNSIDHENLDLWKSTFTSIETDNTFTSRYVTEKLNVKYTTPINADPSNYYELILSLYDNNLDTYKDISTRNKIICLESGLGTGKTELIRSVKDVCKYHRLYLCGYRNSLSIQTLDRLGTGSYHLHYNKKSEIHNGEVLGFCVDSITKVRSSSGYNILILDEVSSVINHIMTSSTLKDSRRSVVKRFRSMLAQFDTIICLDANIDNMTLKILDNMSDGKHIELIRNEYCTEKITKDILMFDSFNNKGSKTNCKPSTIVKNVLEQVSYAKDAGLCVPFITDSKRFAHILEKKLLSQNHRVLVVSSKTKDKNEQKLFIANPNNHLKDNQYDCIILTPTIESGVDISIENYFSCINAYVTGTIGVKSVNQMIGRFRNVQDVLMYANVFNKDRRYQSSLIKTLKYIYQTQEYYADTLNYIGDKICNDENLGSLKDSIDLTADNTKAMIESEILNAFDNMYAELLTSAFFEKTHFDMCLEQYLKFKGHNISHMTLSKPSDLDESEYKELKERVKVAESNDIFNAIIDDKIHTESWANEVRSSYVSTYEDICIATKVLMNVKLPGIIYSDMWSVDLVYKELFEKLTSKSIERYIKMKTQDTMSLSEVEMILNAHDMFDSGYLKTIGDLSFSLDAVESLRMSIIKNSGIYDLINYITEDGNDIRTSDQRIVELITNLKSDSRACMLLAPFGIHGTVYTRIFNNICRYIGVEIKSYCKNEVDITTMKQKKVRYYKYISPESSSYSDPILKNIVTLVVKYVKNSYNRKLKKIKELAKRRSKRSKDNIIYVENSRVYDPETQDLIKFATFITDNIILKNGDKLEKVPIR